jgi:hypothetical protein
MRRFARRSDLLFWSAASILTLTLQADALGTRAYATYGRVTAATVHEAMGEGLETPGGKLWVARYQGPGDGGWATHVGVSPGGTKVFVTGDSFGLRGDLDYATIRG